ncbi:MAG: hypothetical protein AB1611_02900 [bacterium]
MRELKKSFLDRRLTQAESASRRLVRWRILTFALALLFIRVALFQPSLRPVWYAALVLCLVAFIFLVVRYERLSEKIRRLRQGRSTARRFSPACSTHSPPGFPRC